LQVGVSGENQRLDFRDLADAAGDSCGDPHAFGFDLFECPAVAVKGGLLAGEFLPSLDDHVDIFRIELEAAADALR
jgi:hypothetical protein